MENKPQYAILHHTGDSSQLPQLSKVNTYHKLRFGMYSRLGYWVGYHYLIEKNGNTIQCRADNEEGAHTKGRNLKSIGIALAGNFDSEAPTEAQLNSLNILLTNLAIIYKTTKFPLYYHFTYSETHCPGHYFLSNDWQKIILKNKLNFLQQLLLWLKTYLQK